MRLKIEISKLAALVAVASALGCAPTPSVACRPCTSTDDCVSTEACISNVCVARGALASHCPAWSGSGADQVIGSASGSGSTASATSATTSTGSHGATQGGSTAASLTGATGTSGPTSSATSTSAGSSASTGTSGVTSTTTGSTGTPTANLPACIAAQAAAHPSTVWVATLAGNHSVGFIDGPGTCGSSAAEFDGPDGIAVDRAGNVYVADGYPGNNAIRKIDASGTVSTLAGNGTASLADGAGGRSGPAEFNVPVGVALDASGRLFVGDYYNSAVRQVDTSGMVTTLASGFGFIDSSGAGSLHNSTARFAAPTGVAVDAAGNLYLADHGNDAIRKLAPNGDVTTLAGTGTPGYVDGPGGRNGTAELNTPQGVAVDAAGNVYVADVQNSVIRKIDLAGNVSTFAGNGTPGFIDGSGGRTGTAEFSEPNGLAVDAAGNVYVADTNNNAIRKIDPLGNVTTLAGGTTAGATDGLGGPAGAAQFFYPKAVAVDAAGHVFVADSGNNAVRVIIQP